MHLVSNVWALFHFYAFPYFIQILHVSNKFRQNCSVHKQNAIKVVPEHIYRPKAVFTLKETHNEFFYFLLTLLLKNAAVKKHVAVVVFKMLVAILFRICDDDVLQFFNEISPISPRIFVNTSDSQLLYYICSNLRYYFGCGYLILEHWWDSCPSLDLFTLLHPTILTLGLLHSEKPIK